MNRFKSFFICLIGLLLFSPISIYGVQREKNINETLTVLSKELEIEWREFPKMLERVRVSRASCQARLDTILGQGDEMRVVLFSQRGENIFAMAYACDRIQSVYNTYVKEKYPYQEWIQLNKDIIARYQRLEDSLNRIPSGRLSEKGLRDRDKSLEICRRFKESYEELQIPLQGKVDQVEQLSKEMLATKNYTQERFNELRTRVFMSPGKSYWTILSDLPGYYARCKENISLFYGAQIESSSTKKRYEHLLIGALCSLLGAYILMKSIFLHGKIFFLATDERKEKSVYNRCGLMLLGYAVVLYLVRLCWLNDALFINASQILVEYVFMLGAVMMSLSLRLPSDKIKKGLWLYAPLAIMGGIALAYRIFVVPNVLVAVTLPFLLFCVVLASFIIVFKCQKKSRRVDVLCSWLTLIVNLSCFCLSLFGYNFLSLQIIFYWLILQTGIQTLIALRFAVNKWLSKDVKVLPKNRFMMRWLRLLVEKLVFPLLLFFVVTESFVWAAHVFNMDSLLREYYAYNLVHVPNVFSVSVKNVVDIILLAIFVHFIIELTQELIYTLYGKSSETGVLPTFMTVGRFVMWGIYILASLLILEVNYSGIMVVMGGLSVGVGLALKETIDNFICGLSLLLGRVRLGDWVECDGVRGRIDSIGYRTTTIDTTQGGVIAFMNSQLFSKNFLNLTKNHIYELRLIEIQVEYGENVERVRQVILKTLQAEIDFLEKAPLTKVTLYHFAESGINLHVRVWVPVRIMELAVARVRESIYRAFEREHINFPFPQLDVHNDYKGSALSQENL